jgi:NAD(P)H dehydrogenase (quinone)
MNSILVLYYSTHGATKNLAYAIAQGIESAGSEAVLRTVPAISDQTQQKPSPIPQSGDPFVSHIDLQRCSGLALGSPTRFGNMAAAMKFFWDSTSSEWISGTLSGKPACVFTSTASMHGGQESTLLTMMLPLLHHGMIISGLPYSEPHLHTTQSGGTPYGVSHLAIDNKTTLTDEDKQLCLAQGRRLATLSQKLG